MRERAKKIFAPIAAVFDGKGEPDLPMIERQFRLCPAEVTSRIRVGRPTSDLHSGAYTTMHPRQAKSFAVVAT
jgi:hypothetical protein